MQKLDRKTSTFLKDNSQDREGIASPFLRNLRIKAVAPWIAPRETVLDIGCGAGYLADFLSTDAIYYGVDKTPFWQGRGKEDKSVNQNFIIADLENPSSFAEVGKKIGVKADVIVLAAFLEHIPNPNTFLADAMSLLKPGGRFIGTTPHPIGREMHDLLAKLGIASRAAAEEHHQFLDKKELAAVSDAIGGELTHYKRFLFGLNQLFVISFPTKQ